MLISFREPDEPSAVSIAVHNQSGGQVAIDEVRTPDGSRRVEVMITDAVSKAIKGNGELTPSPVPAPAPASRCKLFNARVLRIMEEHGLSFGPGYTNDKVLRDLAAQMIIDQFVVSLTYTNYKGETSTRRILPSSIRFGRNDWHTEPQWLVVAMDLDKGAMREFALKDFGPR